MSNDEDKYDHYERIQEDANYIIEGLNEYDDDWTDSVHEWADNALIYTGDCLEILMASSNDNAAFDHMGSDALDGCDSFSTVLARLAYFAYSEDLGEVLSGMDAEEKLEARREGVCEDCDEVFPSADLDDEQEGYEGNLVCEACYDEAMPEQDEDEDEDEDNAGDEGEEGLKFYDYEENANE